MANLHIKGVTHLLINGKQVYGQTIHCVQVLGSPWTYPAATNTCTLQTVNDYLLQTLYTSLWSPISSLLPAHLYLKAKLILGRVIVLNRRTDGCDPQVRPHDPFTSMSFIGKAQIFSFIVLLTNKAFPNSQHRRVHRCLSALQEPTNYTQALMNPGNRP